MQRVYLSPEQEHEVQYYQPHATQSQTSPSWSYRLEERVDHPSLAQYTSLQNSMGPAVQEVPLYATNTYNEHQFAHMYGGTDPNMSLQIDGYGTPGSNYYSEDGLDGSNVSYFQGHSYSPPTPMSANQSDHGNYSKNGQTENRASSPQSIATTGTAKSRKRKQKKDKPKRLNAPLSELTNDYTHIPVRDMDAWVQRSVEVRHEEVVRKNGSISRPMNSFMLYRSAYAERTKAWCSENNHQVVSSVTGESWPLEPAEIRNKYNDLAKLERHNHQVAHPQYKFSPSKPASASRKRKGGLYRDDDDSALEVETSDADDPDGEWGPPGQRKSRPRQSRKVATSVTSAPSAGMLNSMWQTTNEGKAMPVRIVGEERQSQFYQQRVEPNAHNSSVEDVKLNLVNGPGAQHHHYQLQQQRQKQQQYAAPIVSLPGGQRHGLLLQESGYDVSPTTIVTEVDPSLLAFDGPGSQGSRATADALHGANTISPRSIASNFSGNEQSVLLDGYAPAEQFRGFQHQQWELDANVRSLETGSEFDNWMVGK